MIYDILISLKKQIFLSWKIGRKNFCCFCFCQCADNMTLVVHFRRNFNSAIEKHLPFIIPRHNSIYPVTSYGRKPFLCCWKYFQIVLLSQHSVHPPFCRGIGELTPYQIFKKEGVDTTLIFTEELVRKRGGFEGSCSFYVENKIKSEIFDDKKYW